MKRLAKKILLISSALSLALMLQACGNNNTTGNGTTQTMEGTSEGTTKEEMGENTEGAAGDLLEGAADAIDDVADGVGDAIDNIGGGSFDEYKDAKDYLLDKLSKDNPSANYEIRDEKEDLISYHSTDSKAEGYHFDVYETDGNEKIGTYYVDKDSGKVYRYMGKNSIEAY